ncbi:HPr family phosphocarrier protein [Bacillus sp. JCM 19034]|uniref:HPr family phosphocarrier protein n=1 Tax=Bacillus sp. JCM 19034 TaxID=1481928 RepID=UPI00078244D7|nr:HPr family phosphocarrier protein [Bacillus sp. JCM 19034]
MRVKVLKPIFAETATTLVNTASTFPETILIKKDHWVIDAKSLLGLLAVSLQPDHEVEIEIREGQNDEIYQALLNTGLFEKL